MLFDPVSYGVMFDADPTSSSANTTNINRMIGDINANSFGEIVWPAGVCYTEILDPITANATWTGRHLLSSMLRTREPVGDVLTFNGCVRFEHMGMDSEPVRTSGSFIQLNGSGSILDDFYMNRPYRAITCSGQLDKIYRGSITGITSRNVAPDSGGILNTSDILEIVGTNIGSGSEVNSDMAEFGVQAVAGELDVLQCFVFLVNQGYVMAPGEKQFVNGFNIVKSWADTVIQAGFVVKPTHATARVAEGWISDCWSAAGSQGAAAYSMVFDNGVNAHFDGRISAHHNKIRTYTPGQGVGVYLNGGSSQNMETDIDHNQIGTSGGGFDIGIMVQGGSKKWTANDNRIASCRAGLQIAAGCDKYSARNSYDGCSIPVSDANAPSSTRASTPRMVY